MFEESGCVVRGLGVTGERVMWCLRLGWLSEEKRVGGVDVELGRTRAPRNSSRLTNFDQFRTLCGRLALMLMGLDITAQNLVDSRLIPFSLSFEEVQNFRVEPHGDLLLVGRPRYSLLEESGVEFRRAGQVDFFILHGLDPLPISFRFVFHTLRIPFLSPFALI